MTLLLTNHEVEQVLTMDLCLGTIEDAFRELARGKAVNRPRSHTYMINDNPDDFYVFKSVEGGVSKLQVYAIRLTSDRVVNRIVHGVSRREKLPAAPGGKYFGLILLMSTETCEPLCILPDGFLQRMRVGATYGIAAKYLSRENSTNVGIFGAGGQAEAQLAAVCAVRNITRVRVFSRRVENRTRFAERMTNRLQVEVLPVDSPMAAIEESDIVIAATNSHEPVFDSGWLNNGTHVSFLQDREVDDLLLKKADIIATDTKQRVTDWVMGNTAPRESFGRFNYEAYNHVYDLGQIIIGLVPGRESQQQITVFRAPGVGIQFASVGQRVFEEAKKKRLGRDIPTEWFLEDPHS